MLKKKKNKSLTKNKQKIFFFQPCLHRYYFWVWRRLPIAHCIKNNPGGVIRGEPDTVNHLFYYFIGHKKKYATSRWTWCVKRVSNITVSKAVIAGEKWLINNLGYYYKLSNILRQISETGVRTLGTRRWWFFRANRLEFK